MFVVVRVEAVPDHLRGYLSRFLVEVMTGLYVGTLSAPVAERLWVRTTEALRSGRAALVLSDPQRDAGYRLRLHGVDGSGVGAEREIVDLDDLDLIAEALPPEAPQHFGNSTV
ncbi:MAG: type I-E CRISPR-associated endoribonuclease Cas2e [Pseudoclavibacter sp.]|nr:type I-E CRISPR-associated endoribonuclease Cas2e [Pseudoclavibacter sp.]